MLCHNMLYVCTYICIIYICNNIIMCVYIYIYDTTNSEKLTNASNANNNNTNTHY